MRLSLRFLVPLLIAIRAFAYGAVPPADSLMLRWFAKRTLEVRSGQITRRMQEPPSILMHAGWKPRMMAFFNRMLHDERLYALAPCLSGNPMPISRRN